MNPGERGFTMVELMVSLTVLILGIAGVLSLQVAAMRANAVSRHATEASVLAEDALEALRTMPTLSLVDGGDQVDGQGNVDPSGLFTRVWDVEGGGLVTNVTVTVSWLERGVEPHAVTLRTQRGL